MLTALGGHGAGEEPDSSAREPSPPCPSATGGLHLLPGGVLREV